MLTLTLSSLAVSFVLDFCMTSFADNSTSHLQQLLGDLVDRTHWLSL